MALPCAVLGWVVGTAGPGEPAFTSVCVCGLTLPQQDSQAPESLHLFTVDVTVTIPATGKGTQL